MLAKWGDNGELGEVLMLHANTTEEDKVLSEIRENPDLLMEWYKAATGGR